MSQLVIRIAAFIAVIALLGVSESFAQSDVDFASYSEEVLALSGSESQRTATDTRTASAQQTPQLVAPPRSKPAAPTFSPGEMMPALNTRELLLKLVAGVLLSVSLCVGIMVVGSKFSPKQLANRSTKHFEVIDSMMLGQRSWIELIQVKGQFIVVTRDVTGLGNMVALPSNFEEKLEDADKETLEFEKAAEALLTQKGVTGWKRTKQKR